MTALLDKVQEWGESAGRTDADREGEAAGISTDPRLCACGCGTKLKPTSKFKFIRGHKLNQAIADGADDPEPGAEDSLPNKPTKVRLTKKLKDELTAELALFLSVAGMMWGMRDATCGGSLAMQSPEIAEKLVPIIVKSPKLVKWLTSGAGITVYIELMIACKPVAETFFQHHISKSTQDTTATVEGNAGPIGNGYAYPVD